MKVVNFQTLSSMPTGTVFTKYPLGLNELLIKGEPEDDTFNVQHFSDPVGRGSELFDHEVEITGASFAMDPDNLWVDSGLSVKDMYVVYSLADVDNIIKRLMKAVQDSVSWDQAKKETASTSTVAVEATTTEYRTVGANGVIVEAVKTAGGMVFDDHKPTGTKTKLWGVATLDKGGKQHVVALHGSDYFSVNKLYPHRGAIHLSTESVGGVVSTFKYGTVEAAIEAYNESQKEAVFSCGTLNNVVKF